MLLTNTTIFLFSGCNTLLPTVLRIMNLGLKSNSREDYWWGRPSWNTAGTGTMEYTITEEKGRVGVVLASSSVLSRPSDRKNGFHQVPLQHMHMRHPPWNNPSEWWIQVISFYFISDILWHWQERYSVTGLQIWVIREHTRWFTKVLRGKRTVR